MNWCQKQYSFSGNPGDFKEINQATRSAATELDHGNEKDIFAKSILDKPATLTPSNS